MTTPYIPTLDLSPAADKHPCCRMLKIQPHDPACAGEVRRTVTPAKPVGKTSLPRRRAKFVTGR
jgi:hypothetical protein